MYKKFITKQSISLLAILLFLNAGCKKDSADDSPDPLSSTGSIQVKVSNEVDGQAIQLGQQIYTNSAGNLYQVDLQRLQKRIANSLNKAVLMQKSMLNLQY